MKSEVLISINNLHKSYGHIVALDGICLDIYKGETTAIVGDNGSGKSTLIKILAGNIRPDTGEIRMEGKMITPLTPGKSIACGIHTVYQDLSLDDCKNSIENIFLGKEITRYGFLQRKEMENQAEKLLQDIHVNIDDLHTSVSNLSGGQRQGLAIARTLLRQGKLLMLDEPMAAMGIAESHSAQKMFLELKDKGTTMLIVSHNLFQVFDIADRVVVMRAGKIIADVQTGNATPEMIQELILQREYQEGI